MRTTEVKADAGVAKPKEPAKDGKDAGQAGPDVIDRLVAQARSGVEVHERRRGDDPQPRGQVGVGDSLGPAMSENLFTDA